MARFEGQALACRRGGRVVFAELDFALEAGQALLVTGPNGSGKSSLLRVMAGLIRPAAGRMLFDGQAVEEEPESFRAALHYLGHQEGIKPALTVTEHLTAWAGLRGAARPNLEPALRAFDLQALSATPARLLSAGQRRRLGLARLLASEAALWLLDEPSVGLDTASQERLVAVLAAHRAGGGMVAVSTHVSLALDGATNLALEDHQAESLPELVW